MGVLEARLLAEEHDDEARERMRLAEAEIDRILGDHALFPIPDVQKYGGPSPPVIWRRERGPDRASPGWRPYPAYARYDEANPARGASAGDLRLRETGSRLTQKPSGDTPDGFQDDTAAVPIADRPKLSTTISRFITKPE